MNSDRLLAANYNCTDSSNSAYGAGNYNTCDATTSGIGAPNTGDFLQRTTGIQTNILLPILIVVIITILGITLIIHRRKSKQTAVQVPVDEDTTLKE